ncbi:glycosyltransferase domain-containing protein [Marinoscillum sp. MHG1-6]|uniref:glycosyltransferase domain-containing protein n=1 Tax=Marinoscillum sp. MHG1-6 TaxID=2959627 RepID=UPI0021582B2D|nr:glycosyltransferase domain-containing protein [Marinoscillum sp. MHG1-6]
MQELSVLTFTDKPLPKTNKLVQSCDKNGLSLDIISPEGPWKVNAQKIKLLNDHISDHPDELVILVVDAFDIYINAQAQEILDTFTAFECDIVFAAEANFYFRNPKLKGFYLKNYPASPTLYRFLNSGTFIGTVGAIKKMLDEIMRNNHLDPTDMDSFIPVRSDQYLYGKFFVDQSIKNSSELKLKLDYQHSLMEVAGGRMRLIRLPHLSRLHAFNCYKIERFLVKLLGLNLYQNCLIDIQYDSKSEVFRNRVTGTKPSIIHIPGSWQFFDEVLMRLMNPKQRFQPIRILTIPIAVLSYLVSFFVPVKINY